MTTDSSTGDWTPGREREARERCERATPGPWTPGDDGEEGDFGNVYTADGELLADLAEQSDAAFIAHAREDLPAALAEIERLTAVDAMWRSEAKELVAEARASRARCKELEAEIERLRAPADATKHPADASLEARAEEEPPWNWCPRCKQTVDDDMRTGEFRDGSEGTCLGCGTVYVAVAYSDDHWALVSREENDCDASRPGLTEEQAYAQAVDCLAPFASDGEKEAVQQAILRAARGETGEPGAGDTVWTGVSVIARPAAAKEVP